MEIHRNTEAVTRFGVVRQSLLHQASVVNKTAVTVAATTKNKTAASMAATTGKEITVSSSSTASIAEHVTIATVSAEAASTAASIDGESAPLLVKIIQDSPLSAISLSLQALSCKKISPVEYQLLRGYYSTIDQPVVAR